ncbi:ribosomal-protein-alanine N-acetyltransferase [Clostridium niameyense]|uniref:[Ribosomal protein bS18]-alanine N-acetyltransferase n=1 Tax=Clostridium niameyense TaxID=1622073 RepID=A0A6M0RC77_9CLOT|nr:ribosomal protein S18-alanine N-acetyltransferase [Clostridium niameyense]NEZ46778.1 ribosomal-protein-alanine N-acetyltransferase [Clostridium niameyense]
MSKEPIFIKPFSKDHINDVMEIDKLSFSTPWRKESYEQELKNKSAKYMVALKDNKVIGFFGLWFIIDECHIINIAVHPKFRGLGVGNLMMEEIIKICGEKNFPNITLEVRASNTTAQNLYYKFNFKNSGIRKGYYADNNEDAIIMWRYD